MRKGLRILILLAIFNFIIFNVSLAADAPDKAQPKNLKIKRSAAAKSAVKKTSAKKAAKADPAAKTASNVQATAKAAAERDDKVYDLGNIVVVGEDKTKINDKSKKKTAFLTPESASDFSTKKESAEYSVPVSSKSAGNEVTNKMTAFIESEVGNLSKTKTSGGLNFERNAPAHGFRSFSKIDAYGEKANGYRYKSDYSECGARYSYESESLDKAYSDIKLNYRSQDRNLPGFDGFSTNYINTTGRDILFSGKYSQDGQRFKAALRSSGREFKVNGANASDKYDSTILNLGYSKDLVVENNPLTLEANFQTDGLDVRNSQSSSATSTRFGVNYEKAMSEKTMIQINPEMFKNGDNSVKTGGSVSFILKEKRVEESSELNTRYVASAGRRAIKYDSASFLFPDDNSIVWVQDALNKNRFDSKTYEQDETFIEISAETDLSDVTKAKASLKNSRSDGLLYLTDLNSNDARYTFNSFADGAKTNKFNLGVEHKLSEELTLDASLASVSIEDSQNDLMPYIPKYEYTFGVGYKSPCGLRIRLAQHMKDSMDTSKIPALNKKVDSFSTASLYADKSFSENGKIFFKVDNLFNADLKLRPGYSYYGRTYGIGLNYGY